MKKWFPTAVLSAMSCLLLFPTDSQADSGIMLESLELKDASGKVEKTLHEGELVEFTPVNAGRVTIVNNYSQHDVKSSIVLPVAKTEKKWFAKKGAMLYTSPDLFSTPIQPVSFGSYLDVQQVKGGFVQVLMKDGLTGWVHMAQTETEKTQEAVKASLYISRTLQEEGTDLFRGDKVDVVNYEDGQYLVKRENETFRVKKDDVDNQKPLEDERAIYEAEQLAIKLAAEQALREEEERQRALAEEMERAARLQAQMNAAQRVYTPTAKGKLLDFMPKQGSMGGTEALDTMFSFSTKQLGKPYVWGGNGSPGYDCSGYTKAVFSQVGVTLPRTAAEQFRVGTPTSVENLNPGDLLFFQTYKPGASHVSIYMGEGKMIHAAGKRVQISNLSEPYYSSRYLGARTFSF